METKKNLFENDERQSRFAIRTLLETSKMLVESQDPDFVLNNLLLITMGKLLVTRGIILIQNGTENSYRVSKIKGKNILKEDDLITLPVNKKLLQKSVIKGTEHPELISKLNVSKEALIFNLRTSNHHLGFLCLGAKGNNQALAPAELEFIESLAIISSVAIANSRMFQELRLINRKLDRKVHDLHTLLELSKDFNLMVDQDEIARTFKFAMLGQMLIRTFFFALETDGIKSLISDSGLKEKPSQEEIEQLFELDDVFYHDEDHNCPFLDKNDIRLVIALRFQNEKIGIVGVGAPANKREYEKEDVDFLQSLGNMALLTIQKNLLLEERIENKRMEEELDLARTIQRGLFPTTLPSIEGYDLEATNISSRQVGGDYFDVVETPDGGHIIAIADVTGKGVPASLLMANLQSMLHALAPIDISLSEATGSINDIIHHNTPPDKFITFFWGKISSTGNRFEYVNAGHNNPMLFRKGKKEPIELDIGGVILGAVSTMIPYESESIELKKDDVLVLYTDGVTESMNPDNTEEYGEERLVRCIQRNLTGTSQQIIDAVIEDVKVFSDDTQYDDITLLVIRVV